jgi:hypothetical protein
MAWMSASIERRVGAAIVKGRRPLTTRHAQQFRFNEFVERWILREAQRLYEKRI